MPWAKAVKLLQQRAASTRKILRANNEQDRGMMMQYGINTESKGLWTLLALLVGRPDLDRHWMQ
jgi:hypothetical protein